MNQFELEKTSFSAFLELFMSYTEKKRLYKISFKLNEVLSIQLSDESSLLTFCCKQRQIPSF